MRPTTLARLCAVVLALLSVGLSGTNDRDAANSARMPAVLMARAQPLAGPRCVNRFPEKPLCKFVDDLAASPLTFLDASTGETIKLGAYDKFHRDLPDTKVYAYGVSRDSARYPGPVLVAKRGITTKVWPFLNVRRAMHRIRMLSAANARTYNLTFQCAGRGDHNFNPPLAGPVLPFYLIGSDGGYLSRPLRRSFLLVVPGTRHDLLLDFNTAPGWCRDVIIVNSAAIPFPVGGPADWFTGVSPRPHKQPADSFTGVVMQFIINQRSPVTPPALPNKLSVSDFSLSAAQSDMSAAQSGMSAAQSGMPGMHKASQSSCLPSPFETPPCLLAVHTLVDLNRQKSSISSPPSFSLTRSNAHSLTHSLPSVLTHSLLPPALQYIPPVNLTQAVKQRWLAISFIIDPVSQKPSAMLLDGKTYMDPATEKPKVGTSELWHIINPTFETHPMHLHLVQHRPISRRPINSGGLINGSCSLAPSSPFKPSCFTGPARAVPQHERGWKDTTVAWPDSVLTIFVPFKGQNGKPFPFDATEGPGYVWHCHALEHEDNDMMRPLVMTA
ncbi:unnamed protein product [Closterium sp. Naga37s-1]|nr:unnamed protein product [Closterium sp. Naga37s-1]